jgi:hypothetical protein
MANSPEYGRGWHEAEQTKAEEKEWADRVEKFKAKERAKVKEGRTIAEAHQADVNEAYAAMHNRMIEVASSVMGLDENGLPVTEKLNQHDTSRDYDAEIAAARKAGNIVKAVALKHEKAYAEEDDEESEYAAYIPDEPESLLEDDQPHYQEEEEETWYVDDDDGERYYFDTESEAQRFIEENWSNDQLGDFAAWTPEARSTLDE